VPLKDDVRVSGIYQILNTETGECYLGSSVYVKKRLWDHKQQLEKGIHENRKLQAAFRPECFEFKLFLICKKTDLIFYEQLLIRAFEPVYNLAPRAGGGRCSFTVAEVREIRELRNGGMAMTKIAKQFGSTKQLIWKVINGKSYKWLE
jgi:group I intron endonuclease